ncbi:Uncharacterised protein [uncultured archaeon]|nr:Uncharacterised protein [uncultured archaeon]
MISRKIGKREFAIAIGKFSTDSYSTTIKKLALLPPHGFVQAVPARLCAGPRHIESALCGTFSAFENKTNFSRKPELEFLVRLLGEKQLNRAITTSEFQNGQEVVLVFEVMGNKSDASKKIFMALGFEECKNLALGGNRKELMEIYGIGQSEINAVSGFAEPLEALVIEKTAFVALEK